MGFKPQRSLRCAHFLFFISRVLGRISRSSDREFPALHCWLSFLHARIETGLHHLNSEIELRGTQREKVSAMSRVPAPANARVPHTRSPALR
jgi:hypothetical protein